MYSLCGFMETFSGLVLELVSDFGGSRTDFAKAVGVSPSTLSHFLGGRASHPPSTEVCLRIALASRVPPTRVLRAAGRTQIAELIEQLYGAAAKFRQHVNVTPHEYTHLEQWRKLDDKTRHALQLVVEHAATLHGSSKKRAR
jgi:transcriptional regulator with XRE-family HTH domain